jgi:hypothetical protein
MRRPGRIRGALAAALLALGPGPALSCGFEDPSNVGFQRGMLNFAFPKALWVSTAVWQAQAAGLLEADTSLKGNRALLGFRRASDALSAVARDLYQAEEDLPAFTLVMIGPMLWTRFAEDGEAIRATPHMKGPARGDVVVVSDEPVVLALARGRIAGSTALDQGLIRLYGDAAQVAVIESALRRIGG